MDGEATAPYESMGATLLAAQPATAPAPKAKMANWDSIFRHLESRLGGMRAWRWSWWVQWARLAEFILPRRYKWLVTANRMVRGEYINTSIVDSTATLAMQVCAAGLWTGLTSPSRPWFKLGIGLPWVELDADGKAWLEDTEKRVYQLFAGSNFYTTMAQAFQDVATFGTAPVIIYEDDQDGIRCYLPCAGEYYLAAGSRLSVDVLYREFTLTVAQIVEMFELENCPVEVQKLWETGGGSLEQEMVVAHAIEPNSPLAGRGRQGSIDVVPSRFIYREVYWLRGQNFERPLSVRGFNEAPFMVARWSTVSNDAYGRSPGMDAIGDTMQLQQETRRKAEFIEKGVRPPMGAHAALKNEPSSIRPGDITYVPAGGKETFWPLFEPNANWLAGITADLKEVQERIKECFFVPIFMAITQMQGVQPRNELELTKRDLERLQVLGLFIELFETEFAGPAIKRVLGIMQRRQMLAPMPKSLQNVPLKINYISILKLAQQAAETVGMRDTLQIAGGLSSAAKAAGVPDPLRVINLDEALRIYADRAGFPQEALFTDDEVKQHDQARAQVQQTQQAAQAGMAAVSAAKTLSETQTQNGSALSALLGSR